MTSVPPKVVPSWRHALPSSACRPLAASHAGNGRVQVIKRGAGHPQRIRRAAEATAGIRVKGVATAYVASVDPSRSLSMGIIWRWRAGEALR
jgi:hypothetical protein